MTNTYSEPELANGATTRWIVVCDPHRCEALCGDQERKRLHLVSRDQSDRFALLNMPLITCEAAEGIQIGQRAVA